MNVRRADSRFPLSRFDALDQSDRPTGLSAVDGQRNFRFCGRVFDLFLKYQEVAAHLGDRQGATVNA